VLGRLLVAGNIKAGSLVTRIGPLHADHASPGDHPAGLPTSSSTLPGHPDGAIHLKRGRSQATVT